MQKVKVHRYVSGKRPDYAPISSSEEDSDNDGFVEHQHQQRVNRIPPRPHSPPAPEPEPIENVDSKDPRLRRLGKKLRHDSDDSDQETRLMRHRYVKFW